MKLVTPQKDLVKTTVMVSPQGSLSKADWKAIGWNLLKFVAPTAALFFGELALKTDWRIALATALFAFYQTLSNFFGRLTDGPKA